MAKRNVRVEIPIGSPDKMETLTDAIITQHTALGAGSPLTGEVDMADLAAKLSINVTKRAEANGLQSDSEADMQAANTAMGTAQGQGIDTPGTVYYFTGLVRDRLLFVYKGLEEELSRWGFNVVVSNAGGIKTVSVDIPIDNTPKMEKLVQNILTRHTALGVNSPLSNQVDTSSLSAQIQTAKDKRTSGKLLHGQAQAAMQAADQALGTEQGQNSKTTGTVYYYVTRVRDRLLFVHKGLEETLSAYGFNVVIGSGGTGGGAAPPPTPASISITSNQNVIGGMPLEIIITGNLSASGGTILATWEPGITNSADLTAGGTIVFQHVYAAPGIKNITVAEVIAGVFAVSALQIPNVKATAITLNGDFSTTTTFNFYGNDLPLSNVNDLITQINNYGTSGGMLNISGGTMPVPDPAFPALIALRSRGWMVTTN